MKRVIAFFMSVIMITAGAGLIAFAEAADNSDTSVMISDGSFDYLGVGAVTLTYKYNEDARQIEISGNVNYNVLVTYGKYTLGILRVTPFQSTADAMTAEYPDIAAEMNIAAKFALSFKIKNTVERFSKYAVVLISPEGELILASEPKYISVTSGYADSSNNREDFKGILTSGTANVAVSGDMGFGSAVIPVNYNKLINESMNGYMYPHEDTHLFFDKTYIDELDGKVRTYSATGARVYLQLLLPLDGGAEYGMPDVSDIETISKIYTYVKFLVSRYDSYVSGQIGGIILGTQIDRARYNNNGGLSLEAYAEKYAYYLTIAANTARLENPDIDVVIPISSLDSYGTSSTVQSGDYLPSKLVEGILSELDGFFDEGIDVSIMLESDKIPITLDSTEDGENSENVYIPVTEENGFIGVNELSVFDAFLARMRAAYDSAPKNYIYCWKVPKGLSGNYLECAYVYSYYSLSANSKVSSFVLNLTDNDANVFESVKKTVGAINTSEGKTECEKLLPLFGVDAWNKVIKNYNGNSLATRTEYSPEGGALSMPLIGSFSYFDFSTGDINGWYGASYSKGITSDYGEGGQRVLRQTVGRAQGAAHSDLLCLYEYEESLKYTPALKFKMAITDGETSSGALYEVTVTVGTDVGSVSKSRIVRSGDSFDLWLDMEAYSKENKASYLKISTRSITGDAEEYSLWVYDVSGHSGIYDSQSLNELISAERQNIRNQLQNSGNSNYENIIYWVVFAIILIAIVIGGLMIIILRRDDGRSHEKKKMDTDNK